MRAALAALGLALAAMPARDETLADAIALAYQTNPTLQSERAQLRGVDEGYVQARSALGPTASLQIAPSWDQTRFGYASPGASNSGLAQVTISQSLYAGGRDALGVAAARNQIASARQALRATEGNVMLAVIQAYADVVRDAGSLVVREKNLEVLKGQVTEAKVRVRDGELTLTDVAQAEAQLANDRALLSTAQGQLQISRAEFTTAVGENPGELAPGPPLPGLPSAADGAFDIAEAQSPELMQAKFTEAGSRDKVAVARAAWRPTVSLNVVAGYTGPVVPFGVRAVEREVTGQAVITQPLFTSGLIGSQVRQALDQNTSDRIAIETSRRVMVQNVANAWNQILVSRANAVFQRDDVRAAGFAFTGMRIEYKAGLRATLDVLISEEALRDAELSLLAAEHDQYVAEATLLRVIGRLEAPDLVPGLPQYDPAENLRRVENRGQVPWTPLVERIDGLGTPGAGQQAIPAPRGIAERPAMAPAAPAAPSEAMITALPTAPIPGTASPAPPPAR
ncbi:MAG TPA: TolC family outer membrane protein [Caulobacteraceae bacterium]|nr:TolC family outer membrane protein [Caulobacteraceae bacterium]